MGFDFDRSTSAVVCFWNRAMFSACVVLDEVTPKELALLIDRTVRNPAMPPGRAAAIFAHMAFDVAEVALANVPPAPNVGGTLARIHLPDNAPGGMGFIIVDQDRCELLIYGGTGWDEDYNTFQARTVQLEDVIARLPGATLRETVAPYAGDFSEPKEPPAPKKVTRKRGK